VYRPDTGFKTFFDRRCFEFGAEIGLDTNEFDMFSYLTMHIRTT
jgi:hypothetical protein